ncbi:MAG TPA: IS21-like element helper ATPase IstB [Vicinamibacterales bacterium]|nr:IS21-like element helper ATPase IstB [Vicinamibacterales bacterium]
MSIQVQNLSQMRELRLAAMSQAYELQVEQPKLHQLGFDERFGLLLESEVSARKSRKLNRLVKVAALPELAAVEDIDFRASRGLEKPLVASLASCAWIHRHHNLMILGATGLGKSWLACAFAHQACRLDMSVAFHRASELYEMIAEAQIDASLPKLKASLVKADLLVLDDFGIGEMSPASAQLLLDVVDRRMRTGSLLITSQYPLEKWHDCFPDPTIADAVLDRIVHQAYKIQLKGESMRKTRGKAALGGT